jgi:hypothetical protein
VTNGALVQHDVDVSDVVPGARSGTGSAPTTYVEGSASCLGAGTCRTSYDRSTQRVTWGLGTMAAGATRTVTFQVTIDTPVSSTDAEIPAEDVVNVGSVRSSETARRPSNEVTTNVTAVEAVKHGRGTPTDSPPSAGNLPHTGLGLPIGWIVLLAGLLMASGTALTVAARKRVVRLPKN